MSFLNVKQWTNGWCLKFTEVWFAFWSHTHICFPSFYKSSTGINWCMCIEWDSATTMEKVAPIHLPLVQSLHPSPGPAPLSSLTEKEVLETGGENEDWREKWGVAPKNSRVCLPPGWVPVSSHLKGSAAWEATRADGFVLTYTSATLFGATVPFKMVQTYTDLSCGP